MKISVNNGLNTLCALMLLSAAPSYAAEDIDDDAVDVATSAAAVPLWNDREANVVPSILSSKDRNKFENIFSAIENKNWNEAKEAIDKAPKGPLRNMAIAELYLAAGSPRVERDELLSLINDAPYLPQAEQLSRLASTRGADSLPSLPGRQQFSYKGSSPSRHLPKPVDESGSDSIRNSIVNYIKNDAPASAEDVLNNVSAQISDVLRTELQYRTAWSYYIENDDRNALRLAQLAGSSNGEWAVQAKWVEGLSQWRLGNHADALPAFDHVAKFAHNEDLRSAGYYWASRAAVASKRPELSQSRLQNGANFEETFYGLLSREALGMKVANIASTKLDKDGWKKLRSQENVQIILGLSEIGRSSLAKETLQFQARLSNDDEFEDLGKLASEVGLPETQLWLAHYGPSHKEISITQRYPTPNWAPTNGWRIDKSLAFAHTLQESAWRKSVVSPADAQGLMQVLPGTARDIARAAGTNFSASDLHKPEVNLEYGQSFLEYLRDSRGTENLLPKIIAAYNAGLTPITRWNDEINDGGDPLLYIESIPYWETRGYVATILRNYWVYEQKNNSDSGSKTGIAQNLWPSFPNASNGNRVTLVDKNKKPLLANR